MKQGVGEVVAAQRRSLVPAAKEAGRMTGVAPEDDFGKKLVARKGTIPTDINLEV